MDETTKTPEPETIFLVVGEAGEYSDWRTWIVGWYHVKEHAEEHASEANEEAARIGTPIAAWWKELGPDGYTTGKFPRCPDPLPPVAQFDSFMAYGNSYSVAVVGHGKWPFDLPPRGEVK